MTILSEIAAYTAERVELHKSEISLDRIKTLAFELPYGNGERFYSAVSRPEMSFICEVKKASPSKGVIDPVFDYMSIAQAYEAAGADAVSCLTEPKWFMGSDDIFREIRAGIKTPMLRKDFVVDEYQLYEAKLMGADCVLLICALLSEEKVRKYLDICAALGLAALVETHDEAEIASALRAGARMIGVNNRNLKDFSVDTGNSRRMRELVPDDVIFVSESGVKSAEDIAALRASGVNAVLIGETLMKAPDKKAKLAELKGEK